MQTLVGRVGGLKSSVYNVSQRVYLFHFQNTRLKYVDGKCCPQCVDGKCKVSWQNFKMPDYTYSLAENESRLTAAVLSMYC